MVQLLGNHNGEDHTNKEEMQCWRDEEALDQAIKDSRDEFGFIITQTIELSEEAKNARFHLLPAEIYAFGKRIK